MVCRNLRGNKIKNFNGTFLCNYMCMHNSDNNNSETDDIVTQGLEFLLLFLLFFFLFGGGGRGEWFCALWSFMIFQIVACSFLLQSQILN